ncbi:23S rRNA (adenine(2030)-N(6))-methyltransferase RlmJ [Thioclava atlantica]|uniref:Ribosomal RNA large subunit methyltransferase J n=1 Tax=Thioclava atlantica TaxID=1317124 RepID=A0A085TUV0_9RHOB|nr:23S rRNA (adenine(2030)-N(6))-methyltransferase RlmJ [Thioclava atlantica]KFE34497.1 hypothetical protein DW2_13130 [Thioclava atlantica]
MLSYQHAYHAGNLADVHKHALLATALDYLTHKDKPLSYIETHAGRGLYALDAAEALKTGEAAAGITRVEELGWFDADHPYARALATVRLLHGPQAYPGSPLVALSLLRESDTIQLCELHPQEFDALSSVIGRKEAVLHKADGYEKALALTPPTPRRGMMLIDPSFEVKSDYATLPKLIAKIAKKWNVGIIALWYPVLASGAQEGMVAALRRDFPEALSHEVRFPPARAGHGMLGSGMFVVNPPFGLAGEAERLSALFAAL